MHNNDGLRINVLFVIIVSKTCFIYFRSTGGRRGGGRRRRPGGRGTLVKQDNDEAEKKADNEDIALLRKRIIDKIGEQRKSE